MKIQWVQWEEMGGWWYQIEGRNRCNLLFRTLSRYEDEEVVREHVVQQEREVERRSVAPTIREMRAVRPTLEESLTQELHLSDDEFEKHLDSSMPKIES